MFNVSISWTYYGWDHPGDNPLLQGQAESSQNFFRTLAMINSLFYLEYTLFNLLNIIEFGSSWRSGVLFKLLQHQVTLSLEHLQFTKLVVLRMLFHIFLHIVGLGSSWRSGTYTVQAAPTSSNTFFVTIAKV